MLNLPTSYERVIYEKNPLIEVVCQVRFPTILKIGSSEPVEFQDRIRQSYPMFKIPTATIPDEIKNTLKGIGMNMPGQHAYEFASEDDAWKISIAREFIALTTSSYIRFEDFKEKFEEVFKIFNEIYKPTFFSRVGLRYQNLIVRSMLNLETTSWQDIVSKNIAYELYDPVVRDSIKNYMKNLVFNIGENEDLTLRHGVVEAKIEGEIENCYLIDSDFYSTNRVTSNEEVINIISRFNRSTGELFRWSVSDSLHKAMGPEPVVRQD